MDKDSGLGFLGLQVTGTSCARLDKVRNTLSQRNLGTDARTKLPGFIRRNRILQPDPPPDYATEA